MPINHRGKGAAGERQACNWLKRNLAIDASRNLSQSRDGGADIVTGSMCIEVKRVEKLDVQAAWRQCVVANKRLEVQRFPVLMHRSNNASWTFCVSAKVIGLELGYISMTEKIFIEFANKEGLAS